MADIGIGVYNYVECIKCTTVICDGLLQCHTFMGPSLYITKQFYAFCVYACFSMCFGVMVKWENCISL